MSFRQAAKSAGGYLIHLLAAIFGGALLDRIEVLSFMNHFAWWFFRGFGFSFLMATALGFWLQRYFTNQAGKWVWVVTTTIFIAVMFQYVHQEGQVPGLDKSLVMRVWSHFSLGDCIATLQKGDCNQPILFTTTFIRGAGYSIGAMIGRVAHQNKPPDNDKK
jgi:hypothetical protein